MAERARLTVELARRRLDSPSRENVIARDEQPPIAHEAYLAGQFDRIEADLLNQIDEAVACIDGRTYGILSFSQIESALVMATKSNGKPSRRQHRTRSESSDEVQRWAAGVREHRRNHQTTAGNPNNGGV